jgi:serine-type D-Ala-D-Ala carboxypeptidase (penicillin-binding protein 5/6)
MRAPIPRRWCLAALGACVALSMAIPATASAVSTTSALGRTPRVSAAAGELVRERVYGKKTYYKELWGRDQSGQRPAASITKLMTALVVARAGDLKRRIKITWAEYDYVHEYGASNAGLIPGDILTARALLYAMLLPSGADAAMALAESYGPGLPKFIAKMNALARTLHMTRSHFTNFDGLQSSDVSTPANLIKLGVAAMGEPAIRAVVRRRWYNLPAARHRHHYFWRNTNELLGRYPRTIGIKTGWTPEAGECLLFQTVYKKETLIGVVLDTSPTNSGESFVSAAELLNWGWHRHVPIPAPSPPPTDLRYALGS